MKVKYEGLLKQKVIAIKTDTLVVGVDIAKNYQWARFVDFRGIEHDRALKFKNSKGGFETILTKFGRYFELYLPYDVYAELRGLSTARTGLTARWRPTTVFLVNPRPAQSGRYKK